MTKYFEHTCTRMYSLNLVEMWARAEENLGLTNSIFISIGGRVTQYVDSDQGEKFHNELKQKLTAEYFDEICEKFFGAIEKNDLIKMFECLSIFDEIDNYPEIAEIDILRRLERVRKNTESVIYALREENSIKDYILFKNKIYT